MQTRFRRTFLTRLAAPAAAIALNVVPCAAADADTARQSVVDAVADFYARISARDLAGVLRHMPPDGFMEIGVGAAQAGRLDRHNFEAFFKAAPAIDLRAVDLAVQQAGDMAIVTGLRVGSITYAGQAVKEQRSALTMVWTRADGRWLLRHVHLSAITPG